MARCLILLAVWLPQLAAGLDGEDFVHGQQQLEHLLADRPALTTHLPDEDPLRTWVVAQFAGSATEFRVYWDPQLPPDGVEAQHRQPAGGQPAVLLHPYHQSGPLLGQPKSFHDLWADLIFEFHNIAQGPAFQRAFLLAVNGRLGYHGWLEAVTRAEHQALIDTNAFYRTRWRPWMRRKELEPHSLRWEQIQAVPEDYATWIRRYTDPSDYPYASYGDYYRDEIQPVLQASGRDWQINPFQMSVLPRPEDSGN